jgi:hypothetical protein
LLRPPFTVIERFNARAVAELKAVLRRVAERLLVTVGVGQRHTPGGVLGTGRRHLVQERGAVADVVGGDDVAAAVGDGDRGSRAAGLGERESTGAVWL